MTVTITINGVNAHEARCEMIRLLGNEVAFVVPAVSDTSSDKTDNSADNAEIAAAVESVRPVEQVKPTRTRKPKAEPAPVAPTPVEYVPQPGDEETGMVPSTETAAQDAADEAAETEAAEDAPLTLDDVRNAVAPYIAKWTIAVAQADVGHLIKDIGGADKISELDPANQENLRNLVAALNKASASDTRYVKAA